MGRILLLNMVLFIFPTYNPRICYRGIFKDKGKSIYFLKKFRLENGIPIKKPRGMEDRDSSELLELVRFAVLQICLFIKIKVYLFQCYKRVTVKLSRVSISIFKTRSQFSASACRLFLLNKENSNLHNSEQYFSWFTNP